MESDSWYGWLKDSRVIVLAGASAVAGFVIAALIFAEPWHLPPDWGDIPTWLATLAATAAGLVAYRVYQIESQRDRVSEQERRSTQAAKVAAWYGFIEHNVTRSIGESVQTRAVAEPIWGAFLRNASDLPVFDVAVEFHFPPSGTDDSAETWNVHTIDKLVLAPGDAPIHLAIDETALRIYSNDPKMDQFHRVEIAFTDTRGVRWHRDIKGRLKDITNGVKDITDGCLTSIS